MFWDGIRLLKWQKTYVFKNKHQPKSQISSNLKSGGRGFESCNRHHVFCGSLQVSFICGAVIGSVFRLADGIAASGIAGDFTDGIKDAITAKKKTGAASVPSADDPRRSYRLMRIRILMRRQTRRTSTNASNICVSPFVMGRSGRSAPYTRHCVCRM